MSRAISSALVALAIALVIALGAAVIRVGGLEAHELDASSAWIPAGSTARLLELHLLRGDDATFELCARDPMDPARWSGRLAVVRTDRGEEMFGLAIDPSLLEGASRSEDGACVVFARVRELAIDEEEVPVAVELAGAGAAVSDVPVRARVLARRPLDSGDLGIVLGALGIAIALVLVLILRAPIEAHDGAPRGALRAALGVLLVLGVGLVIGVLGPRGPTAGLVGGLALACAEISIAYALVRPSVEGARLAALGLGRPARAPSWVGGETRARRLATPFTLGWVLLAPVAGLVLSFVARAALALVPSTGEAPIEAFVSWPSGLLSFAALAVVAPVAEEVFFRGLVYGALRGNGGARREGLAITGAWLLFALAHAPQDWGNWGGLASVLIAGLGFTLMRAASGSTLVPCVAHLVYNGLLAAGALVAGAG